MKAHIVEENLSELMDVDNPPEALCLATVHPADPAVAEWVLSQSADPLNMDGRSEFMWIRLANGDLILGVYPQGETYWECEKDAQFPGVEP